MRGSGRASVQLRLDSGNLRVYHALAALRLSGATIELPHAGVAVESVDGEIPLTADLLLDGRGLHLLRSTKSNAYSRAALRRSASAAQPSQLPLDRARGHAAASRSRRSPATCASTTTSCQLSQLELGVRGGRVTGQCIVDWREDDSTVQLRVRASDVASSHGEPFDGNAAVVISTRERSVDGRAEILRIGKRHLFDLLDLHDPHHADAAVNRVRSALALGYPSTCASTFRHGFADARITFGGLARLVRVDELRGIPMGPIVDKLVAPLERKETEE